MQCRSLYHLLSRVNVAIQVFLSCLLIKLITELALSRFNRASVENSRKNPPEVARAILSVFPLDSFVPEPVFRMEVVGNPDEWVECHHDLKKVVDETSDRQWKIGSIERHDFYDRARKAYAVVCAGGERRGYGCFILIKGVIDPDGKVV